MFCQIHRNLHLRFSRFSIWAHSVLYQSLTLFVVLTCRVIRMCTTLRSMLRVERDVHGNMEKCVAEINIWLTNNWVICIYTTAWNWWFQGVKLKYWQCICSSKFRYTKPDIWSNNVNAVACEFYFKFLSLSTKIN